MNRTGIPTLMGFQEGGDVENEQETADTSGIMSTMLDPQDVTQNFALYSSLLNQLAPEPRRLTGYDLASELGKGLLAQQGEKFPSLGRGIGLGFQSFKSLQDEIEEKRRKAKADRDAMAFGLASKSKKNKNLQPLSLYKDDNANIFNAFIVGNELVFKGYDKESGDVLTLNENEFFTRYPTMRPTTDAQIAAGMLTAKEMNKLQGDIKNERDSGGKLQDYLINQKDREVGFKLLADNFVGLFKTTMGQNNLTEDELKKRILDADFQSLLGGFRIETVGPGVMTEYDAQRIVESLGGQPGATQNPTLVASVLRDIFRRKVDRINMLQNQYNEQITLGNFPLKEKYDSYEFNTELFEFKPKFPEGATNKKTNEDGSIEYDLSGKRFKIRTDGIKEELGQGLLDGDIDDIVNL